MTDATGCASSVTVTIGLGTLLSEPHLCMVTSDEDGYNRILWEDPVETEGITHYEVYRNTSGQYDLVGSIEFNEFNELTDKDADPRVQAYTYRVQALDDCGNRSPFSNEHKTIHLVMGQGLNGSINLSWGTYVGQTYDQVIIYRGTTPDNLEVLATVSATSFSYTDVDPPAGDVYYQLEIVGEFNCNTGRSLFSLKSNIIDNLVTSSIETVTDFDGSIYPNPVQDQVTITLKEDMQMIVYSLNGQLFLSENLEQGINQVSTSHLQSGVYYIELMSGAKRYTQRIVKMK